MTTLLSAVGPWLAEHSDDLVAVRRHLHAHPEPSYEEYATTELIAERLTLAGYSPTVLSSGTGLVADLDPDPSAATGHGPRFGLRADIDALRMADEKTVPYRSQVPGVAHACGHDVHTAVMLGAAAYLARHRSLLPGPVRFIFQPAEERVPGGATVVVKDGCLDGLGGLVGFHCDPRRSVGTVGLKAGAITSASDLAVITLQGPGGHTARPDETVDMVTLAARLVLDLPARVGEAVGDPSAVRFVFGAVHAGDAANAIPAECTLRGSVRSRTNEIWERLPQVVDAALASLLHGTGASHTLRYTAGVPSVMNDPALTAVVGRAATRALGPEGVTEAEHSWGGDDFAWYTREVPATYVRLGTRTPGATGAPLDLHAGRFDVDEHAIAVGVRVAVASVAEFFADARRGDRPVAVGAGRAQDG